MSKNSVDKGTSIAWAVMLLRNMRVKTRLLMRKSSTSMPLVGAAIRTMQSAIGVHWGQAHPSQTDDMLPPSNGSPCPRH